LKKWTTGSIPVLGNKRVIVTGANSGIGFQMARVLSSKGAQLIIACRNPEKARIAADKIKKEFNDVDPGIMQLDLSSLESVNSFAADYRKKYDSLDVLINNAGVMATPYRTTKDGFEWQFGINHLGHFALTGKLIKILMSTPGSRVVNITSIAHFNGKMHFDDLSAREWYSPMKAYRQSKLANLLFSNELQSRLEGQGTGVISVAAHPGLSSTNIVKLPFPLTVLKELVLMSALKGALPALKGATDVNIKGGEYIGPAGYKQMYGYPAVLTPHEKAYDLSLREKLWTHSEEMTGVNYLDI